MSPLTAFAVILVLAYASVSAVPAGGNYIDAFRPRECQKNAHFVTCGTACPDTCENKDNPPTICTLQCVIGCACKEGFYETKDQTCVRAEECV